MPADIIFEPKDSKIKNIKRKTHLKNAAVVHAKNGDKTYSGFTGSVLMEELTLGSITEESDRENRWDARKTIDYYSNLKNHS